MKDKNRTENETSKEEKTSKSDGGLKKVVQDIGIVGISRILTSISGLILLPILTRTLGAYGYGLWTQAMVTIGLIIPILLLGLQQAIVRIFPSKDLKSIKEDFMSIMFILFPIIFAFFIFMFLYPNLLADLIFDGEIFVVKFVALIIFVYSFDTIFFRVFQAFREMKKYALAKVLTKYGELGLASFLVFTGYGLFGALAAVLIIRTGLFLILTFELFRRFGIHKPKFSRTKEYLNLGLPYIPSGISYWFINTSDRYLISYFLGVTFVGYYSPGYTIGMSVPLMLGGTIFLTLKPSLSFYYDNNKIKNVTQIINLSLKYLILLLVPFFFGILIFHEDVISLFTTPEIARNGSFIAIYIAFNGLIYVLYSLFQLIILLEKKTKIIGVTKTSGALINIVGNIFLIPWIGIKGAAITTLISFSFITLVYFFFSRKYIPLNIDIKPHLKIVFSSVIMYLSLLTLKNMLDIYFIFLILLGISIYFGIVLIIQVIEKKELKFVIGLIKGSR